MMAGKHLKRSGRIRPGPISAKDVRKRSDLIIRVATHEFLMNGFEDATLAAIAKRCRISKTTLYDLFESKEALFSHVAAASIRSFQYDIQKAVHIRRPFKSVLRDVVEVMVHTMRAEQPRNLLRLVVAERDRFPSIGRLTLERTYELLRPLGEYLKAASGKNGLAGNEAQQLAYHLMSMSIGGFGCLLIGSDEAHEDASAWIDSVVQLFTDRFPAKQL